MRTLRALLVEDSESAADPIIAELEHAGFLVEHERVSSGEELRAALGAADWDVVLSEHQLRDLSSIEILESVQESGRDLPVIIISGSIGEENAAELMRLGVNDYLVKENLSRLGPAIIRELQDAEVRREKAEAERALAQSEERLKLALGAAGLGAWERDLITNDVFWSPETAAILGTTVAGARLDDLHWQIFEEDRPMVQKKYDEAIETRLPITVRFRLRRPAGETIWVSESAQCEYDENGTPLRLVGTIRDITRDKAAEDALIEAEERYRVMAESAADAVISIDEDSRIIFANAAAEKIFGHRREEMLGRPLAMIQPEQFQNAHVGGLKRFIRTGQKSLDWRGIETSAVRKDGTEIAINISFGSYEVRGKKIFTAFIRDITERLRAQRELRRTEARLRSVFEQSALGVALVNSTGVSSDVNDRLCEILGYPRDEMLRLSYADITHPDDRANDQRIGEWLASGEASTYSFEKRFIRKDGKIVWANVSGGVTREPDGSIDYFVVIVEDITERKLTQEELARSRGRLADLINSVEGIVWEADVKTFRFTFVSRQAEAMLGYTIDEWLGERFWEEHIHRDDREWAMRFCVDAAVAGRPHEFEYRMIAKDGRVVWLRDIVSVVAEGEEAVLLRGIMVDVTEARRAEAALRRSEARYRHLFDNNPYPMWVYDVETLAFLAVNEAAVLRYGYSEEEFLRMRITDIRPEEEVERVIEHARSAGRIVERTGDWRHRKKDGTVITVEISSHALEWEGRRARLVLSHDVTERLAAEAALRASEEQLRQSQKLESIGTLAGGIAHDFNNMLTAINGYSDLILRKLPPDDPIRGNITEIRKAGERSADLTRQLLAFSRRQIMQPSVFDLNATIDDTVTLLRRLIGEHIRVETRLASGLRQIEADPGQFAQVLVNLAVNARDAMPDGGTFLIETSNVTIDEEYAGRHIDVRPGSYVMLAVSDTGIGMDEPTRMRIFEPFFTTKTVGQGTGLGLSTVYGIVKQSGGNIWVYSEPGKGTTFKIYLPEAEASAHPELQTSQRDLQLGQETILLVEDEETVRHLAREILESCGYTVVEAANGAEAIKKLENGDAPFDLLVTDLVMPEMGGRELAEKVRERSPATRVLFTSGYTDDAIVRHGIIDEGTNFLQKPFTFDSLSKKVRALLDHD